MGKDWDKICRELSSPESSDAEDDLNVLSVQKNAKRVSELVQNMIPGFDTAMEHAPPMGMNRVDVMRQELNKQVSHFHNVLRDQSKDLAGNVVARDDAAGKKEFRDRTDEDETASERAAESPPDAPSRTEDREESSDVRSPN